MTILNMEYFQITWTKLESETIVSLSQMMNDHPTRNNNNFIMYEYTIFEILIHQKILMKFYFSIGWLNF